jgi:acyl dehydratase
MSKIKRPICWEDVTTPSRLISDRKTVSASDIKQFGMNFDPQPYHLDRDAARTSIFGGLCASGWHVCAIMMRLLSDKMDCEGIEFIGNDEIPKLKWLEPVFEDDSVYAEIHLKEKQRDPSNVDFGIISADIAVKNQRESDVMVLSAELLVKARQHHDA